VSTTLTIAEAQTKLARLVPVSEPQPQGARVFGLSEGEMWMSDDFNAPLPESFWLGETQE